MEAETSESEPERHIKFGKCSLKNIYFVICPLTMTVKYFYEYYLGINLLDSKKSNVFLEPIFFLLGHVMCGIIWYFERKITVKDDNLTQGQMSESDAKETKKRRETVSLVRETTRSFCNNVEKGNTSEISSVWGSVSGFVFINEEDSRISSNNFNNESLDQHAINEKTKKKRETFYLYLSFFLFSLLNYIGVLGQNIVKTVMPKPYYHSTVSSVVSVKLLCAALFSKFTLPNVKIYKHQVFSLIIIVVMNVLILICDNLFIAKSEGESKFRLLYLLLVNVPEIVFIYNDTIIKKYYLKCIDSQFIVVTIMGAVGLVLLLCTNFFFYFIKCDKTEIKYCTDQGHFALFFQNFYIDYKLILYNIGIVLFSFVQSWSIFKLIYELSANHFAASAALFQFIISIFELKDILNVFFDLFAYVVLIFGCLVYNEFIVLYFYGLAENTYVEIVKREDNVEGLVVRDVGERDGNKRALGPWEKCGSNEIEDEFSGNGE